MRIEAEQTPGPVMHDVAFIEDPTAKRVAGLILPFLVMVAPARRICSVGMGTYQVFCLGREAKEAESQAGHIVRAAYVTVLAALQILDVDLGERIQTVVELGINVKDAWDEEGDPEAILRVLRSVIDTVDLHYDLSIFKAGTMGLQLILDAHEMSREAQEGHYLEVGSSLLQAGIRVGAISPTLSSLA